MGYLDVSGMEAKMDMKKIKVFQVINVGYMVKHMMLPLIDRLANEGYQVEIVCSDDEYVGELRGKGYSIRVVEMSRKISPVSNIRTVLSLYKLIRKEKPTIVHTHGPVTGVLGRIAAKLAGCPLIMYTAHGFYFHENMPWLKRKIFIFIELVMGRLATDMIFTQSKEDLNTAVTESIIKKDKVECIGNGVDILKFSNTNDDGNMRLSLGINNDDKVIGFIGRITKEKGIVELAMAVKMLRKEIVNVKLLVIGGVLESERDNKAIDEVKNLIKEYGLENNIIFTGFRSDISELLTFIDVFTLPSYREGMPRSIIEAMASGKPVVATNIRGCREEVVSGATGILVPVGDSAALAEAIRSLVSDDELRMALGKNAFEKIQSWDNEAMVGGFTSAIESVVKIKKEKK